MPADMSNTRRVNRITGGVPAGGTARGLSSLRVGSMSTPKSHVKAAAAESDTPDLLALLVTSFTMMSPHQLAPFVPE